MRRVIFGLALSLSASLTQAAVTPITGWIVHNGTSTVGGTSANPTFTPGSNLTLMAPFSDVTLANNGDFVEVQTTLNINGRTANTGAAALNTQLRLGVFDDSVNSSLTAADAPNLGFTMEYSNVAAGGLIREQQSGAQTNPFTSPASVANGTQDANAGSIQGANPGAVTFDIKITRDNGKIDFTGTISGTDSVTTKAYLANFSTTGYASTDFPANGAFTFNRIGLFLGSNVSTPAASLSNSNVISAPEPASFLLVIGMAGAMVTGRRKRRS